MPWPVPWRKFPHQGRCQLQDTATRGPFPEAAFHFGSFFGAGFEALKVVAENRRQTHTNFLGAQRVAFGLLFDDALQHAVGEGYTSCLDRLNIVRSKEFTGRTVEKCVERAECDETADVGEQIDQIGLFEKLGHGRSKRGEIIKHAVTQKHGAGPIFAFDQTRPTSKALAKSSGKISVALIGPATVMYVLHFRTPTTTSMWSYCLDV